MGSNFDDMKAASFFSMILATGFLSPVLAKETLPTAEQRFGGKIQKSEIPSFRRHVVPLASKLGCSGRECHGSFQGRGGFQLSLFGYDFAKDHKAITNDTENRIRVNREKPEESLFLQKPMKQVKHKGGEIYEEGSWEHNVMLKWIQDGAKLDVEETGAFDRLEVFPKEFVGGKVGDTTQLKVLAYWKDGTVEDVTGFTRFDTNDESVATVDEMGEVKIVGKGDSHVVAFYDNGVLPLPVMLPVSNQVGAKYPKVKASTPIDKAIVTKLQKVGIVPSEVCTDQEFLRRVTLDVTGTLPTAEEVKSFLTSKDPKKRQKKVDELLGRPAYAAWWSTKLNDFQGNSPQQIRASNYLPRRVNLSSDWYNWVYKRVLENRPYDEIVEGIVLASGRSKPEQSYIDYAKEMAQYHREKNPKDFAERKDMPWFWARRNVRQPEEKAMAFAYSFLGVRIQCAQCHKHPFDQWTQQDFNSFKAFFERITMGSQNLAQDKGQSYRDLTNKLRDMANYNPKDPRQNLNRLLRPIVEKRVENGEPVPWQEVYIREDRRRRYTPEQIERIKKRNPNFNTRVITPKVLGGDTMDVKYPDPRTPLMAWLRARENPYFARAFVNRVWAHYFNRGLVEPADDLNLANPPTNSAVMEHLAKGFVASGYDMKWVHREILNSDTYQRSWRINATNEHDEKNFSRYVIRRLPAEVAADAIRLATGSSERVEEFASNMDNRMIGNSSIGNYRGRSSSYMLGIFGKPQRENNCDCERTVDPTLLQTLYTRNDPEMLTQLSARGGWLDELRREHKIPSASDNARQIQRYRVNLQSTRKRLAQLQGTLPKKPAAGDDKALKVYEAKMTSYRKQKEKLDNVARFYTKKLAELQPKPGAVKELPKNAEDLIVETFLRTVSRYPTQKEMEMARDDMSKAANVVEGVQELLLALLNTKEFMVNH
ncbi:MAG: hypothetical protein CMO74_04375 [Verrucomicrobiales bacterium]|nr:hypothetical protein [Verrucomicrobiales bacterium]|tara:strand:- start:6189 stop:8990 length:2802 start_codon:yes stop_codon:yes gene_type:complete